MWKYGASTVRALKCASAALACMAAVLGSAAAASSEMATAAPAPKPMIVFAWNYTPDPSISPIKRAVQANIHFGDGGTWAERTVRFCVDGQVATARQAAARLREVPVLSWAHPYHYTDVPNAPANFSPEAVKATEELVALAKSKLLEVSSEEFVDRINHVTDFEAFADFARPNLVPGTSFAVQCDHASTACHLFGTALRECNWDQLGGAGAANYGTCHAAKCPSLGVAPHFRQTPAHVPGSMDKKTTFLTGYTNGGPQGCLTEAEVLDGIAKAKGPIWLAIEDYQPGRGNIIRAANASGKVRLLGLWGTEHDDKNPDWVPRDRERNREWARRQDSAIAEEVRLAGVQQ